MGRGLMFEDKGKLVRIPMRFIDGEWVFEFGGSPPAVHGTAGELVMPRSKLTDDDLLRKLTEISRVRILDQGTVLRAYVVVKEPWELTEEQEKVLLPWNKVGHEFAFAGVPMWSSRDPSIVELRLDNLTEQQRLKHPNETGGLWLRLEGMRPIGLISSSITMPGFISKEPAISLNHAFTLLSETYEPWRMSHTGNVYTRFFYQESDGLWYPLELLRQAEVAESEQKIAYELWQDLRRRMANGG